MIDDKFNSVARQELVLWAMEEDGTRTKRYVISILLEQVIRTFVAEGGAIKSWHSLDTDFNNLIVPAASVEMVSTILELIGGHARPINPS